MFTLNRDVSKFPIVMISDAGLGKITSLAICSSELPLTDSQIIWDKNLADSFITAIPFAGIAE